MNQPDPPILNVRNFSVTFRGKHETVRAVKGVSYQLIPGETLGIVGESGSGKSVTSLGIIGLLPPTAEIEGEIWFRDPRHPDAEPVNLLSLNAEARRKYRGGLISMVFQEPLTSLNPVYTCGNQVVEAIRLHQQVDKSEARQRAIALFQEVQLPEPAQMIERYPHQISGGQQQRVMIAMALAGNPAILIADEPTTALDVTIQDTILQLLRNLQTKRDMAVIFITHDMGVIAEVADRVVVMYRGEPVESAKVYDLFARPQHPYTQGLLNCRPQPDRRLKRLPTVSDFMTVTTNAEGELEIVAKADADSEELTAEISAAETRSRYEALTQKPPLLTVRNLTKAYPVRHGFLAKKTFFKAVDQVSFEVYPGETLGLVGESGCGKSTLSRCLLRLIEPTEGEVTYEGQPVLTLDAKPLRDLRRKMQIIFQNPYGSLNGRQNIGSAVMEPMQIHHLYDSAAERRDRAVDLLERVGLDASALPRMPHEFSGGQRQRICIARTLACEPSFIICDESVSALDVSVQAQVLNLLKDLQADFGLTYIFISHDLSVVKFVSDRIMVMNAGRLEEIGPADEIYNYPQKPYTQQLIQAIPNPKLDEIQQRQTERETALAKPL
ncbi:ABC transporter ATP-binding protein [Romeria aff. gracilis LEGE 07310]|uniref:ABC transporter ATP-binding protein n=1 Tax=Vasconcelosia minhoensis LEGE 07310 TaxID=915328 RepID=A0A8J7DR61_9CYAN|nr:ABC transporter ATP-binding protein [Romeria gracilis]MBE9077854.1 ABC transporter ATP-binding protein [Romeria aff. gracilis LEGE 07310]